MATPGVTVGGLVHGGARVMLVLSVATALAACISSAGIAPAGQPFELVALTTDTAFHDWPADSWWRVYGEADLDRLIENAIEASPSVQMTRARLREAAAAIAFSNSRLLPQVTLGVDSTYQRYPEDGIYPPALGGSHELDTRIAFDGSYELDFFGRNRAAIAAATSQAQARAAAHQAARVAVATTVARVYFELARLVAEREVVAATRAQREKILTLVHARVAQGIDSNVELRQAEGAIPQIQSEIEWLDENIALMRTALAKLAVVAPAITAHLSPRLDGVATPALPHEIPSDLLARRADLTAARWRIESAVRGTDVVKAEFYPSVNLSAFAGITALGLSSLFEAGARIYGLNPTVSLPIFDGDRLRSKLEFATAEVDVAVADYNESLLSALQEVVAALTSLRALDRRMQAQQAAQAAAESAYDLALQRYKVGLTGYLTVLATESDVLTQHRSAALLKSRALTLNVELNRALGGGFNAAALTASN